MCAQSAAVLREPAASTSSRVGLWSGPRDLSIVAMGAVCVVAVVGYLFTADQRGYYSDDFALREWFVKYGWFGGYGEFCSHFGIYRPLGVLNILAWYGWLWDWPIAHQALMLGLYVLVCLLVYRFVLDLTSDTRIAVTAASLFAGWHTFSAVVVWTSAGGGMLPMAVCSLASLILFERGLNAADSRMKRRFTGTAITLFLASVLFYDQNIGLPLVYSALAWSLSTRETRCRAMIATWPFWLTSALIGLSAMLTSTGTVRPLEPGVANTLKGFVPIMEQFWAITIRQPWNEFILRSGAPAAISQWANEYPGRLFAATLGVISGCGCVAWVMQRSLCERPILKRAWVVAVCGGVLTLATLGIMASKPVPAITARHTMLPALGISMMIAAGLGVFSRPNSRKFATATVVVLLGGTSLLRLGYVYEWSVRTLVTNDVLNSLASVRPDPSPDELIILDGVRKYGRGFMNAWGLSSAFSMDRGVDVRVGTVVRRRREQLFANEPWDLYAWKVDPAVAKFFIWNDVTRGLQPSSFDEYCRRHPKLLESWPIDAKSLEPGV